MGWKITTPLIAWWFSIVMLVYQRVTLCVLFNMAIQLVTSLIYPWNMGGFCHGFFWYQKGHPGHLQSELDPFIKGPVGWRGWLWMTGSYWWFTSFFWERQWQWSIFSGRNKNFWRFFEKHPFLKIKSTNFGWLSQWIRNGDFIILNFGNYFQFMIKSPFLSLVAR
jgi:hypothetical protein